jgi:tRNA A-37 threonylcarbamoyl transferase component Bud32
MNAARLAQVLPERVRRDIPSLLERFVAEGEGGDSTAFLAMLFERGLVTAEELRDALAAVELSFTLSDRGSVAAKRVIRKGPRYQRLGLLGRGAMGEVHMARDADLHRNVALKQMDPDLARDPVSAGRFHTEIQITAQLDHPGIVPVYSLEDESGTSTYAMKLIRGRTLGEVLSTARKQLQAGTLDDRHALPARLELFLQVCAAMEYAHARGVIHRDLKPENIMVGPFFDVVVMDWGIAKLVGTDDDVGKDGINPEKLTETHLGMAIGTPIYMSPEQAQGQNATMDARSDQYALGLLLFEVIGLRRAISGTSALQVHTRAADGERDPLVPFDPKEPVPRELSAIVDKATALRPDDRYESVAAFAEDIRRYLRNEPVLARPDNRRQAAARWLARNRDLALAGVFGLIALLIVVSVGGAAVAGWVVGAQRDAAAQRERKLLAVRDRVSWQAVEIDNEFQRYEGLARQLAGAAEYALDHDPASEVPFYLSKAFFDPATAPPDLEQSSVYKARVSLDFADNQLIDGLDSNDPAIHRRLEQLNELQPTYKQLLLLSIPGGHPLQLPRARQRQVLLQEGAPMVWSYVAIEEGIVTGLPGVGDYPDHYDPRVMDWYENGKKTDAPIWGIADNDESGMGLLIPCTVALHDHGGNFMGVAALDVSIPTILSSWLEPKGLEVPVDTFLVGEDGRVFVSSKLHALSDNTQHREAELFPYEEARRRMMAGESAGHVELDTDAGRKLIVWGRLWALHWDYVVVGDAEALLK